MILGLKMFLTAKMISPLMLQEDSSRFFQSLGSSCALRRLPKLLLSFFLLHIIYGQLTTGKSESDNDIFVLRVPKTPVVHILGARKPTFLKKIRVYTYRAKA